MDQIYDHFIQSFHEAQENRSASKPRIGVELKFPVVKMDGTTVGLKTMRALWQHLETLGWQSVEDEMTGRVIGAKKPGPQNDTFAGCETGFSKSEFSLAHTANLFDMKNQIEKLREELAKFTDKHQVAFLGYGIQPVTPPSKDLVMKKSRTSVWHKVFGTNRHIPEKDGYDMHLFTINAANHVHISIPMDNAIKAINVLNGFAGAQMALTANSNIWKGKIDPDYKCVAEKFWDWWIPENNRVGVPSEPFEDFKHYCQTVSDFKPVYVKRNGKPIVLKEYDSFAEYFRNRQAVGVNHEGDKVKLSPRKEDIDLHSSCYWFNARLSRYQTVENRTNDQQPPENLLSIAALTLGLVSALDEAQEALDGYHWDTLRKARKVACKDAIQGQLKQFELTELSDIMLNVAQLGLSRRRLGEQFFLEPLKARLKAEKCPADEVADVFKKGGIQALIEQRKF